MPKMEGNQQMGFMLHVYSLMFNTPFGQWTQVKLAQEWAPWLAGAQAMMFVGGTVRAMDVSLNLEDGTLNLRFMEQNPNKKDPNTGMFKQTALKVRGELAQAQINAGQRAVNVMWVINRTTETWLGRIENGQWYESKELPTYSAMPAGTTPTPPPVQPNQQFEFNGESTEIEDDFIDVNSLPEVEQDELAAMIIATEDIPPDITEE